MSFEHAPVTKGLMLALALSSIAIGIFDLKHYVHLQLVPHLSKYHQYWRLFSHHLACANSSDLLLVELLLYNFSVRIERTFGSVKFASFLIISTLVSTISTFLSLLLLHAFRAGTLFNVVPAGPIAILFSILYQYGRLVPDAYQMKVFGLDLNDKIWVYILAGQLAISQFPSTLVPALVGLHTGYLYRSDILQLKSWRIPHSVQSFCGNWISPWLGEGGSVRRTNRVLPDARQRRRTETPQVDEEEVVTTARRPSRTDRAERLGRQREQARRLRDIQTLSRLFPSIQQSVVRDVVERRCVSFGTLHPVLTRVSSPNFEAAAGLLLSSQGNL
ncbi:hypothetical protein DAEQUDRAFT_665684 [Daedalea quercina L-15889]|uniref:Uncharacterized protein n=1 Tax=Daedalea quercina L-15889 TaxID=1314783 RepID=A0A165S5M7_9APHY|nr:hypothetical protein DAEQUDRAFT_665684 [Daedalea quercina L-15889]